MYGSVAQDLSLASLFTDNMVLQQLSSVNIWGTASPGEKIAATGSWGKQANTVADESGAWKLKLGTVAAGGPFTLSVKGSKSGVLLKNVLLGEVWICSGQSNMEMPLKGWPPNDTIETSSVEIPRSANSNIRFFTVQRAFSLAKESSCTGKWLECTPASAAEFSATAYFFGKKVNSVLNVPVGLINTSWGGTAAEAWASAEALGAHPDFSETVKSLTQLFEKQEEYTRWLEGHEVIDISNKPQQGQWENLDFGDATCAGAGTRDETWPTLVMPKGWESSEIGSFDGAIWFRKWVEIPVPTSDYSINLPGVDDMDQVWVNGVKVGATEQPGFWQTPRHYPVPAGVLKPGKNLVAIRILDNQGGGGIWNERYPMELRSNVDTSKVVRLDGSWKYLIVAELRASKFHVFDAATGEGLKRPRGSSELGSATVTALFNAMINPLIPYTIKGAIWYQGETNVGRGQQYQTLFPLVIKSWRDAWGQGNFPFYFVQLCPWNYGDVTGTASAELRDAQRLALGKAGNTGMVVTLDIGDINTIHPAKKQPVGERLAAWALARTYGKNVPFSGPLYKAHKVEGNKISIEFEHAGKGLKLTSNGADNGFEIAGADGNFVPAKVEITGNKAVVSSEAVTRPARVRYAFRNASPATLFNAEGFPASTFETE